MTNKEALEVLKMNRDIADFNPMTGETSPMNKDCEELRDACDIAIFAIKKLNEIKTITDLVWKQAEGYTDMLVSIYPIKCCLDNDKEIIFNCEME